jgi:hypothetical protein
MRLLSQGQAREGSNLWPSDYESAEMGRLAVKVINHLGDEVTKVFKVWLGIYYIHLYSISGIKWYKWLQMARAVTTCG